MPADLFISWVRFHGRSERIAELLGIDARFVAAGRSGNRWTVPVRYAVQVVRTVVLLRRRRPSLVVAMGPPLLLPVLCRVVHRGVLVLDAHTGAVLRRNRVRRSFLALARRVDVVVVASESLAARLRTDHRIDAVALHDPVPLASGSTHPREPGGGSTQKREVVVFPAGWRSDEPIHALLGAARLVPEVEVVITGRPPAGIDAPANVRLTGFLDGAAYDATLAGADAILALTTRSLTMQRAGYEALVHGRPLVASDTDVLREFFTSGAVFATPTAESLAAAITDAIERGADLAAGMATLRDHRVVEDQRALAALQAAIERAT